MIAVQLDDNPPLQFSIADKNFSFGARVYKTLYIPFGAIQNKKEHQIEVSVKTNKDVFVASTNIFFFFFIKDLCICNGIMNSICK